MLSNTHGSSEPRAAMLAATSTGTESNNTSGNGDTLRTSNARNRRTTTVPSVSTATRGQVSRATSQRKSATVRARGTSDRRRGNSSDNCGGSTSSTVDSSLSRPVLREKQKDEVGNHNRPGRQQSQPPQVQPQRGLAPERGRGSVRRTGSSTSHRISRGRGRGSSPSTAELDQALGQILRPAQRQPQILNNTQPGPPHSHEQQNGAHQNSETRRTVPHNPPPRQYQPNRVFISTDTNTTNQDSTVTRVRSALGAYTAGEQTQLENGVGVRAGTRTATQAPVRRQPQRGQWVQDENLVSSQNNTEIALIPIIDLTNMDGRNGNAFGGARGGTTGGRGRGGSGESGGGRGRGGLESGGGGGSGSGRGRGRGRGGDSGPTRGAIRGGRGGGRGRGGSAGATGTSGGETNGYGSGYESGGAGEGPESLFITDGNDTDMDSEIESERENGGRGAIKEDRAVRFSEGTTGHHKMTKLKAARERERADLIRRGIIDDPDNRKPLSEALIFVGTCMEMCPMFEREERQFQKSVDKMEIDPTTGLIDPRKAVKAFHRPAAGNESALPSDVRPPPVLVRTLDYLVKSIVGGNQDLMSTHGFVRDRTRGIRQDFTLQNYRGLETIDCHERIARYHILCIHQLAQDDRFVLQQEMEQLQKTMTTLNELYDDAKKDNIPCANEPEFRTYQILLYIHDTECQRAAHRWGFTDTDSGVQQALRLHQAAFRNGARFFNLLRRRETTYLMGCIAEAHFYHIRKEHLRKMRAAYNKDTTSVTLADIERQLGFDHKSDLDRYLEHFGIETALDGQGEEYIVPNRNFDDSRPQLRPTCNQRIVEAKRQGRKIPDVINGITGSSTKLKGRAGPFQEDFSAEADSGPRKIQSWVPDEEEPNAMSSHSWEDSQAYSNPMAAYQSPQGHQQGRVPFQQQQHTTGNLFQQQQQQPAAPGNFSQQSAFGGPNQQPSPFNTANAFQKPAAAFAGVQAPQIGGAKQPPPSAFQQAMSAFPKPAAPAFSVPPAATSAFNPAAAAFQPAAPAFQNAAPAFQKPLGGAANVFSQTAPAFSQTAPAFSKAASAPASAFGNAFSAVFGAPSISPTPSPGPQAPTVDPRLANKTASPINAFATNQQAYVPQEDSGYLTSVDQSDGGWQHDGGWEQEGGYYEGVEGGEGGEGGEGYFEEQNGAEGDDDELAMRQAEITRRQCEVAQKKAEVEAQLEETKRMLAEKETAQQKKREKKQSELRQSLLKHNFTAHIAQQQVQQQQSSVFSQPQQQQQAGGTLFSSYSKPPEQPPAPQVSAFAPPAGALSSFFQNFQAPQPSPGLSNSIVSQLEKEAATVQRVEAPKPEASIVSKPQPEREPSPPREDPAVLLQRFTQYATARMRDVAQAPNATVRKNILSELQGDLQEAFNTQPGLDQCYDILATALDNVNLAYATFCHWRKRAAARVRKAKMAALRAEKRRSLADREKGLGTIEQQWVPVKIKIRPEDNVGKQGSLFKNLNFDQIPLDDIFANPIQKAFTSRGIVRATFSLLCLNAEPRAEYWWLRKFGISSGGGIGVATTKKKLSNGNVFTVERVLREPAPPTDVGALIFGCRADWSMSNEERFAADKRDLHLAVDYALRNCRYDKLAVMVICYRSPSDDRDAEPYGEDRERTEGEGRKNRLKAVRKALNLNALPKERVIAKEIVLLETLQDLNLVPVVKRFAKTAAGVVGGDGLGKKEEVKKVIRSKESGMELVPYEEVVGVEDGLVNGHSDHHHQRPAKRKISSALTSPLTTTSNKNLTTKSGVPSKKRSSISPTSNRSNLQNGIVRKQSPAVNGTTTAISKKKQLQKSSTPGSEYFLLKSHGIHVSPPPLNTVSSQPPVRPSSAAHQVDTSTDFQSSRRAHQNPLPLLTRSSASATAFADIVSQSTSTSQQARKRTRPSQSQSQSHGDYRETSPPKRRASSEVRERERERERRELEEHESRTSAIRSALYDFENDPVVMEARRIREAPEYHPELEWPELVMGGV